jgi:uncharacterized phage protein (TIGR01671 family)
MRDIKFRAWDNDNQKFFEPTFKAWSGRLEELHISMSGSLDMRTMEGMNHESRFPGRFILMQYTGLKDKNGKEIYEGDIVRFDLYKGERVEAIEWENIGKHTSFGGGTHNATVIGNIYENPELLK